MNGSRNAREAEMLPRTGITVILCFFFSGESHAVSRYLRKRKSEFSCSCGCFLSKRAGRWRSDRQKWIRLSPGRN